MKTNVFRYIVLLSLALIAENNLFGAQQPNKQTSTSSQATEPRFKCTFQGCEYIAPANSHLECHMNTHTGEKPFKCTHDGCTKAFAHPSALSRHNRTHTQDTQYQCNYCDFKSVDKGNLNRHIAQKHKDKKVFNCTFGGCTFGANKQAELKKHMRDAHKNTAEQTQNQTITIAPITQMAARSYQPSQQQINEPVFLLTTEGNVAIVETTANSPFKKIHSTQATMAPQLGERSSLPMNPVNIAPDQSSTTTHLQNGTPLHIAALKGEILTCLELLKRGQNPSITCTLNGMPATASQVAFHAKMTTLAEFLYLIEHGKFDDVLITASPANSPSVANHAILCPLCTKTFTEHEACVVLPCNKNHVFHGSCLNLWRYQTTRTNSPNVLCPTCSLPISTIQFKIYDPRKTFFKALKQTLQFARRALDGSIIDYDLQGGEIEEDDEDVTNYQPIGAAVAQQDAPLENAMQLDSNRDFGVNSDTEIDDETVEETDNDGDVIINNNSDFEI